MKNIARKKVEKEKPDVVVLQVGGNDLHTLTRSVDPFSPIHIAQEIMGAGKHCGRFGARVAISAVLPRLEFHRDITWELNLLLRGLCEVNNFTFIDQSSIVADQHLLKDGVHLNAIGTSLFAGNILTCLNELSL